MLTPPYPNNAGKIDWYRNGSNKFSVEEIQNKLVHHRDIRENKQLQKIESWHYMKPQNFIVENFP